MATLVLHQFPISHYCEKIRWILDRKGLAYTVKNQLPGMHVLVNRRLVGRGSVPLLVDGGHAIGNSSDIALYIDDQFPHQKLIPSDATHRAEVLALEAYFDEHAGPPVRRYLYGFVLARPRLFRRLFFAEYTGLSRLVGQLASGLLARQVGLMYRVKGRGRERAWQAIESVAQQLEQHIAHDPTRYLVGKSLTLADVTAASLLAPLVAPPESPWAREIEVPELVAAREALRARPAGQWVMQRYARDRHRSTEPPG